MKTAPLLLISLLALGWASLEAAPKPKPMGGCSVSPAVGTTDDAFTITASGTVGLNFHVIQPNGVAQSWPIVPAGTVSYSYPASVELYPLQVGTYIVVVNDIESTGRAKMLGSCSFTVVP